MTGPQRRWIRRNIPKELWAQDDILRQRVPPPEHFTNYGDEDPDDDEQAFLEDQAKTAASEGRA